MTTIFQTNILFKTNKCHHGGPLGAEGPGQLPPLNPALRTTNGTRRSSRWYASNFHFYTKTWFHCFRVYVLDFVSK